VIEALRSKMRRMRSLYRFDRKALRSAFMLGDVMGGRFFEDWKEGEEFVTSSRIVTDLVMFAAKNVVEIVAGWISRVSMEGNLIEPLTLK
jgi:hypothetical protein